LYRVIAQCTNSLRLFAIRIRHSLFCIRMRYSSTLRCVGFLRSYLLRRQECLSNRVHGKGVRRQNTVGTCSPISVNHDGGVVAFLHAGAESNREGCGEDFRKLRKPHRGSEGDTHTHTHTKHTEHTKHIKHTKHTHMHTH
jgi:hypothetical protein